MYHSSSQSLAARRPACQMISSHSFQPLCLMHGRPKRGSRARAVDTVGSSSEQARNLRRMTLSLELDGSVPEGHPDSDAALSAAAGGNIITAAASRRRVRRVNNNGSSNGSSSSSNGSGNGSSSSAFMEVVAAASLTPDGADAASRSTASATPAVDVGSNNFSRNNSNSSSSNSSRGSDTPSLRTASSSSSSRTAPSSVADPTDSADATAAAASLSLSVGSVSNGDGRDESTDSDNESQQLQDEIHQASCCQDVLDVVADEIAHFTCSHTVSALNRLAKLSKGLSKPQRLEVLRDRGFILLLGQLCHQAAGGQMTSFQLSNCIYSCGVLQVPLEHIRTSAKQSGSPQLLAALESSITSKVTDFNDRDVASTLYGYAQLKVKRQHSLVVVGKLASHAQSLLDKGACSPRSTSMILWALATLFGTGNNSSTGTSNGNSNRNSSSSSGRTSHVPLHPLAAAAARQLQDDACNFDVFGSQGVANSLWGLAKLGHHDQQLLDKTADWLAGAVERCKMQEVMNILWAAGAGRHRPLQLTRIVTHIANNSKLLKPADMASLFHVLGIFGFDFSTKQDLLQQLLPAASAQVPQMKPLEATCLYWGLGMTRQVDNTLFRDLTRKVAQLQQQQLQAQAQLDQQREQLQQQQQQRQQQEQKQQQQELAVLQARARQLPDSLQRQAFQAYIAARLEDVAVELPPDVLDAFRVAWLAGNSTTSSRSSSGSSGGSRQQQQQPLLAELNWMLQQLRIKGRVATRSRLDKLLPVDCELLASGQRLVALQLLDERDVDSVGSRLASVQWEEDVLKRNGYDEVFWLRVSDYKRVPKEARPRYIADLLRKLGVHPQERLLLAAEKAWLAAGCKPGSSSGGSSSRAGSSSSSSGSWGDVVGAGGISAAELDVLMQDGGSAGAGGWASGGKGSRSRRGTPPRNKRR